MGERPEPVLILHGGTGSHGREPAERRAMQEALRAIADAAYRTLAAEGAVRAVCHAVRLLEDDVRFNAGTGSQLQADGRARLSACVADGARLRFAAVINLENFRNPVLVAERLLEENHRVLAGDGALSFARERGFEESDPRTPESIARWERRAGGAGTDTVGACALDAQGGLASATSTGGIGWERPGRVSDSATPAGGYADAKAAASATGIGEEILAQALASKLVTRAGDSDLEAAFRKTFEEVRARGHRMGAVGVDAKGRVARETTSGLLAWAWKRAADAAVFE